MDDPQVLDSYGILPSVTEVLPDAVTRRPAETGGGVAAAVAALIAYFAHITEPGEIAALVVVVGFVPAGITWTIALVRKHNGKSPSSPTP